MHFFRSCILRWANTAIIRPLVCLLVYATLPMREQCPGWHMGWCFGWIVFPVIFRSRGYVRFKGGGGESRWGL